jgi:glycogen synthase
MLGWEFPPLLTGGLGQACYGLFKALSNHADLTVIIPRSDKNLKLDNVRIIGLNNLGIESFEEELDIANMEEFAEVKYVDANLNPYPINAPYYTSFSDFPIEELAVKDLEQVRELYNTNETYGPNIMQKVATYTEVVTEIARNKNFDIIHAHDWITYPAALKIKEASGKPLVVHVHSLETDRVGVDARNTVYDIEQAAMEAADRIIPVSEFTKHCIIKNYDIDRNKIFPVYNSIDPIPTFREERKVKEKIIAFVGRVTYQKGPELMIETAERLAKKVNNFKFVIAGTGDRLKDIVKMSAERGLSDKFIFTGFLSKKFVNKLLAQADVYFMPSVSEPFGLSALEASQFQIPCVLSKQSGVVEILPNVLKADFWDVDRFANYLYALLHYEGIRTHLIENSKKDIVKMNWSKSAERVMEVYKQIA